MHLDNIIYLLLMVNFYKPFVFQIEIILKNNVGLLNIIPNK
jgi:hypothetical protein